MITRDPELLQFLEDKLTDRRKERLHEVIEERTRHFTVAVENVYQPHNASAVIRSCECFGIQDLYVLEKGNEFIPSRGIVNGADKWVDLYIYRENEGGTAGCIKDLRENGYQIVATTPHKNDCLLEDFDVTKKSAFFFGTEKDGLSDEIMDEADQFLKIPIVGFTESFNISVSVALILQFLTWKLKRQSDVKWPLSDGEKLEKKIEWAMNSLHNGIDLVEYFHEMRRSQAKQEA